MKKQLEMELKVGLFVAMGLGLILLSILVLGSTEGLLTRKNSYYSRFQSVDGLVGGAKVFLGGIHVGTVDDISFDETARAIRVSFNVKRSATTLIRSDSGAEIATQGVLGDKYISVTAGSADKPALENGTEIPNRPTQGFSQFLTKSDALVANLNSLVGTLDRVLKNFEANNRSDTFFKGMAETSRNLSSMTSKLDHELENLRLRKITGHLEGILEKINNGTGTLGALVNDPSLYDDAKKLVGETNRNRIVRNLVRQTLKDADQKSADDAAAKNKKP